MAYRHGLGVYTGNHKASNPSQGCTWYSGLSAELLTDVQKLVQDILSFVCRVAGSGEFFFSLCDFVDTATVKLLRGK